MAQILEWIPVGENLPKTYLEDGITPNAVLSWDDGDIYHSLYLSGDWYEYSNDDGILGQLYGVTHWMLLPKPPVTKEGI